MATNWSWVVVILASVTASHAHAGERSIGPARDTLIVRTYNGFGVSAVDLSTAEATAGHVFEDVGIRVVWMNCGAGGRPVEALAPHCNEPAASGEVILRICAAAGRDQHRFATMGVALIQPDASDAAVLATVFADRVLDVARAARVNPRPLLGMAMGHELGHLLLSTEAHAALGLMRANWSQVELRRTKPSDWRFLDTEAQAMRNEVRRRTADGSGQ